MLPKIGLLLAFVAPALALAQEARPVRPIDEPTQVDGSIIEDANDPPPLELCPTVCRLKATGQVVRRICLMDEPDMASADEDPVTNGGFTVVDNQPNAAAVARNNRPRRMESAVPEQATGRRLSAAEKSKLPQSNPHDQVLSNIDVECTRYQLIVVGVQRSNKCRVSSTAYCLYNPAGKTGSPCNCGTRAGYFG